MATITKINNAKGVTYRVQVRKFHKGKLIYSEAKTFLKRSHAQAWAGQREAELFSPEAIERIKAGQITLADLLAKYENRFCSDAGRTKQADIRRLQTYQIAQFPLSRLTSEALIQHVRLRLEGAKPQTVNNDLIWIETVLKSAYPAFGIKVDLSEIEAAKVFCRKEGMVHKADQRERRPTAEEIQRLSEYFSDMDGRAEIPMLDIFLFAIHSSRRQAEITRLLWSDNDDAKQTGMVRDLKHPRKKKGNNVRFRYTAEAWEIVQRQPKTSEYIFPYNPRSIGAAFARACKILEIEDLTFHDLRHEATSRLFEKGYPIHEVQQFTLHRDWKTLQRYVNLRPEDVALR